MHAISEPQKSDMRVMSDEVLQATVDFFCGHQNEVEFVWHGGEPLLAGMDFYQKVVGFQKSWKLEGKKIANFLQTNGTLVTEEWAHLLSRHGFHVGVSFDAPLAVHDTLRLTKSGQATATKALEGIGYLKKHGVFGGVSCCVGRTNYHKAEEIIGFFLSQDIKSLKFLRIKDAPVESITADQFANFILEIFDIWVSVDDPNFEIRDIKSVVDILLGGECRECTMQGRCDQYVTVYRDGSIFACDSLPNTQGFEFGTVFDNHVDVLKNSNFKRFVKLLEDSKDSCKDCSWYEMCRGRCLKDRIGSENSETCQAVQKVFTKIKQTLLDYGLLTA